MSTVNAIIHIIRRPCIIKGSYIAPNIHHTVIKNNCFYSIYSLILFFFFFVVLVFRIVKTFHIRLKTTLEIEKYILLNNILFNIQLDQITGKAYLAVSVSNMSQGLNIYFHIIKNPSPSFSLFLSLLSIFPFSLRLISF